MLIESLKPLTCRCKSRNEPAEVSRVNHSLLLWHDPGVSASADQCGQWTSPLSLFGITRETAKKLRIHGRPSFAEAKEKYVASVQPSHASNTQSIMGASNKTSHPATSVGTKDAAAADWAERHFLPAHQPHNGSANNRRRGSQLLEDQGSPSRP